jgi:hypothetical protein
MSIHSELYLLSLFFQSLAQSVLLYVSSVYFEGHRGQASYWAIQRAPKDVAVSTIRSLLTLIRSLSSIPKGFFSA